MLAALGLGGVFLLRVAMWRPLAVSGSAADDGFARVSGVVHVHTTSSDGGGAPEEVVAAAQRVGLQFVVITDHNNLDAKGVEGYHDGVLVVVGSELSTTAGHLLGLGIRRPTYRFSGDARDGLEDVRDLGGYAVAAHPASPRSDFAWSGWDLPGGWGMEILNGDSEWRGAGSPGLLKLAALYPINPRYALLRSLRAPKEALARWDRLLAGRDASGLAGADAHSRVPLTRRASLRLPSYEALFGLAQNHVLMRARPTGGASADAAALVEALAAGRSYVGLDALAPTAGFSFVAEDGASRRTMGETVAPGPALRLKTAGPLPENAVTTLLRDGVVMTESARPLDVVAERPGVYRVEVRLPGWAAPLILTNPIYVFGPEAAVARRVAAAWPPPAIPSPARKVIEAFAGKSVFVPEFDPSSSVATPPLAPGEGPGGRDVGLFRFRLGKPVTAGTHTWCALVDREKRDLSGFGGLRFGVRASGEFRFWLQVWDENPASAEAGAEWWFASVRTSPEWRTVEIPFDRLRSINPKTDGRLDLEKVTAIALVIDRGALDPGAEGSIWIDEMALF